jgi:hypothetical protein
MGFRAWGTKRPASVPAGEGGDEPLLYESFAPLRIL